MKTGSQTCACPLRFRTAQFTIAKRRKQTQVHRQLEKQTAAGAHAGPDRERKGTLTTATSVSLERVMLSAVGQTQKARRCDFTYTRHPEESQSGRQVVDRRFLGGESRSPA